MEKASAFWEPRACVWKINKWAEAEDAYQKAIAAEPKDETYLNASGCLYREKKFKQAWLLQTGYWKKSHLTVYWENLGLAYEDVGQLNEAKAAYEKAVEIDPQNPDYYFRVAMIQLKQDDKDGAIEVVRTGVSKDPGNPELLKTQGEIEEKIGKYQDALETYKRALVISPQDEYFNNRAGICCFKLNDNVNAIHYYRNAISANPKAAVYYENLGLSYDQLKDWNSAITAYEKALPIETNKGYLQLTRDCLLQFRQSW